MPRSYYIRDDRSGSPVVRRALIVLLVLALVGGCVIGVLIYRGDRQVSGLLNAYEQALADQRYDEAIGLYRQAQEKALATGVIDRNQELYKTALAAMEKLTADKLETMESKLLRQEKLGAAELAFAENMAEVTAVRLIAFLRGLCADYLTGKIGRPVMEKAFAQLASLKNIKDAIGGLPAEFDQMTAAQARMIAALESLGHKDYWSAWQGLTDIIGDQALAGFTHEQAETHLETCKKAMYQPLLDAAREQMAGGRYLSAQTALTRLAGVFPDDKAIKAELTTCKAKTPATLVDYSGAVEVISIKPLIVNPAAAFDGDAYSGAADDSMLTVREFSRMLEQLYANNYILIDSERLYTQDRELNPLQLPEGKKPLVLVVEGLNYYASRRQTGNCWNLVMDEGGEVAAEYRDAGGQMVVDRQGEAIGILDLFVEKHPDFSLDGAKGTLSLTGYECIFGLVTDRDQLDDRNKALKDNGMPTLDLTDEAIAANRKDAQEIMDRLKMTGWLFASSTYGFIDARSQMLEALQADTKKWLDQVASLTGPVNFLNYPNGSFLPGSDERAAWLKSQGFILFGGLGTTAYLYDGDGYIYVDKTPINGYTLRHEQTYQLSRLFDVGKVYDPDGRKP